MGNFKNTLGPAGAMALAAAGIGGFILLFARRMNVFWLILAPVIFAVYMIPSVVVYALWKKKRAKSRAGAGDQGELSAEASGDTTGNGG